MTSAPFAGDPLAFRGKRIIENHHASLVDKFPIIKPKATTDTEAPDPFDIFDDALCLLFNEKVGILGAGIGGLYTALILDSLDIPYEILEASGRAGGRLKTYYFPNGGTYDYYVRSISSRMGFVRAEHILYFRKREPCDSHSRRKMKMENIRMGR